jgi:hypothetical protein
MDIILFNNSTDARDKIYSVHGLMSKELNNPPSVDYSMTTIEVYDDFTKYLITSLGCLWILSYLKSRPPMKEGPLGEFLNLLSVAYGHFGIDLQAAYIFAPAIFARVQEPPSFS